MSKYEKWPVIGPIILLLKSPTFFVMVVTVIADILVSIRPEFEQARMPLMAIITLLGGLLMSGQLAARLAELKGVPFWQLPFFGPVSLLVRSRKFWYGVGTLLFAMLAAVVPEVEPVREELIATIALVGMTLIGGVAIEDAAASRAARPPAVEVHNLPGAIAPGVTLEALAGPQQALVDAIVSVIASPTIIDPLSRQVLARVNDMLENAVILPDASIGPKG